MKLDCGHDKDTGFFVIKEGRAMLVCFMCAVRPVLANGRVRRQRRSHEEVLIEKRRRDQFVRARREFNARKRAEREERRRAREAGAGAGRRPAKSTSGVRS